MIDGGRRRTRTRRRHGHASCAVGTVRQHVADAPLLIGLKTGADEGAVKDVGRGVENGRQALYAAGAIGGKIGEEYIQIPKENLKSLFDLIESGASSEDEDLSTAVLTGLLETMTDPLMEDREIWKQAQGILGENSLRHMLAMNKFYGIE